MGSTDLDEAVRQFPWRDLAWWQLRFSPCSFDVIPPTSSTSSSVASTEYTLTTLNPTPLPQSHSTPYATGLEQTTETGRHSVAAAPLRDST